jgi:nitrogen fixation-related uncharacterized protein
VTAPLRPRFLESVDGHSVFTHSSLALVLAILAALWWAVYRGQFESVDKKGSAFFVTIDDRQHTDAKR